MSLELKVIDQKIGSLEINFDELKEQLDFQLERFKGFVVTENNIPEAKDTRARLNKVEKQLDDRRKEFKKEIMKPYTVVEEKIKILTGMISDVTNVIDTQLKTFEEKEKEIKKNEVINLWLAKDYKKVSLEQIWSEKWLNKTVTLKQVEKEIDENIVKIESDLNSIQVLVVDDEEKVLALQSKYLVSLDLQRVLYDYQQEEERKKFLSSVKQNVVEDEPVRDSVNIQEKEATQTEEDKPTYLLQFEVVGTEDEIMKLSQFLKANNYKYRKL